MCGGERGSDMSRRRLILAFVASVVLPMMLAIGPHALAQGGSVGGVIGKKDKTLTGDTAAPAAPAKPAPSRRRARATSSPTGDSPAPARSSCRIAGTWSWGPMITATFKVNGIVSSSNNDTGKWTCSSGQLTIKWSRLGNTTTGAVSDDGKQIGAKSIFGNFTANRL